MVVAQCEHRETEHRARDRAPTLAGRAAEEQLALAADPNPARLAELSDRFPLVLGAGLDLGGLSGEDLFTASIELLLAGLTAP